LPKGHIAVQNKKGAPILIGLRDRALNRADGVHLARVGAAVQMKVEDYYVQKRRGWVRLHEKGGKVNELPCHHNLEEFYG
jgi:integrase/recombinase XerD